VWRGEIVDQVSLHLEFRHHPNERVAKAAHELLETAFVT
jgi:hypothetical protein